MTRFGDIEVAVDGVSAGGGLGAEGLVVEFEGG